MKGIVVNMKDEFKLVSANENNEKYENMIHRELELYKNNSDLRSEFERDYNRIINILINRYDQNLSNRERENQQLKMRLKELEGYFV